MSCNYPYDITIKNRQILIILTKTESAKRNYTLVREVSPKRGELFVIGFKKKFEFPLWIIGQLPASDAISCNEIKDCFSEKIDCLRNDNSIGQKRLQINSQIIRITQKMVDIAK